jgi:hypothetical protein
MIDLHCKIYSININFFFIVGNNKKNNLFPSSNGNQHFSSVARGKMLEKFNLHFWTFLFR